jgi:hypothetical protein
MSSTNPLVIFHFPTSKTTDGLDDRIHLENVNVKLPANIFPVTLTNQNTTGIKFWRPSKNKNLFWGGFQYSIESISLTNQITVAFNRNNDIPLSLQGSTNRHSNDTIEPLIPQAILLLRCKQLRQIDSQEGIQPRVTSEFLNIHIPIVSSNHSELRNTGIRIIDYSPGVDNHLFEQMNPLPGNEALNTFELDLTFLQFRKGVYQKFYIIKTSNTDVNIYMNSIVKVFVPNTSSTSTRNIMNLYPFILSSDFQTNLQSRVLIRPSESPSGKIIIRNNKIEPILYATLQNFQMKTSFSTGIPAVLFDKDGNHIKNNHLINSQNRGNIGIQTTQQPQENIARKIITMFFFISVIIIALLIFYKIIPFLWSLKNFSPIIMYILLVLTFIILFAILFFGYNFYNLFYNIQNGAYQTMVMMIYIVFIGGFVLPSFTNGFSNMKSPSQFMNETLLKETIQKDFQKTLSNLGINLDNLNIANLPSLPSLPLLQETEFKNQFIDTYFNGNPLKMNLFTNFSSSDWEVFKKHLAYQVPSGEDETSSSFVKSLQAFVLKDLPNSSSGSSNDLTSNLNNYFKNIQDKIHKYDILLESNESESESKIGIESNIGMYVLNGLIYIIEFYLLYEIGKQLYLSFNELTPDISDENYSNQIWNIIMNCIFGIMVLIILLFHLLN